MRVIERGQQPRLALEPREPLAVRGKPDGQDLNRHVPVELRIAGAIHLTHPADAQQRANFVAADSLPDEGSVRALRVQQRIHTGVIAQQRFDLGSQRLVATAGLAQKRSPIDRRERGGLVVDPGNLRPAFVGHCDS